MEAESLEEGVESLSGCKILLKFVQKKRLVFICQFQSIFRIIFLNIFFKQIFETCINLLTIPALVPVLDERILPTIEQSLHPELKLVFKRFVHDVGGRRAYNGQQWKHIIHLLLCDETINIIAHLPSIENPEVAADQLPQTLVVAGLHDEGCPKKENSQALIKNNQSMNKTFT